MSLVNINIQVFDEEKAITTFEISKSYKLDSDIVSDFINSAIVSILSGNPQEDIITTQTTKLGDDKND